MNDLSKSYARPRRPGRRLGPGTDVASAEAPVSKDRARSLTSIFTWSSQLFLTFPTHTGFHGGHGPRSSVSLSQRIMSHCSTLPRAQVLGVETEPRRTGTAAAGLRRRAMAQASRCVLASLRPCHSCPQLCVALYFPCVSTFLCAHGTDASTASL